jgi:hypothetical protein
VPYPAKSDVKPAVEEMSAVNIPDPLTFAVARMNAVMAAFENMPEPLNEELNIPSPIISAAM